MKKFLEKNYVYFIVAILGVTTIISIINADRDTLIYDESAHIAAGYSYLTEHDMRLNPEHPPLLKNIAAIPLLFIKPNFDVTQSFWTKDNADDSQWNAGKSLLFESGNDPDQIVFWSRLPFILLFVILGLFIFKWVRELAGIVAGLFALTIYAFDPNILGHNHFVTTDLGIAAFTVFALYYFLKFIKEPTGKNILLAGIFLGLVQLVKFSSVLTFPILGLAVIIYPLVRLTKHKSEGKLKRLGEYILKGAGVFAISLVIVYGAYYFNTYNMPQDKLPEIMDHYFKPYDPRPINVGARAAINAINQYPVLMPIADYSFGVARVFQRVAGGNVTYFLGEVNTHGFLAYFPIVFLLKETLPMLFLTFFSVILVLAKFFKPIFTPSPKYLQRLMHDSIRYLRFHITEFSMFVFIALYATTSIVGRLNIGFRHLFPMLPFIYILVAVSIFRFIKTKHNHVKIVFNIALFLLTILLIIETASAYPYYTSYFNQLAGGPKNGYKLVTDSNADWGQDLKRLRIFLDEHPEIEKVKLDYFGMASIDYYLNGKYEKCWSAMRPIEPGWYAISVLFLQEGIYDERKSDDMSYRWLKNKKPTYQVGTSILIYYISPEEASCVK